MSDDLRGSGAPRGTGDDFGAWFDREFDVVVDAAAVDDAAPVGAADGEAGEAGEAEVAPSTGEATPPADGASSGVAARAARRVVRRPLA